MKKEGPKRILIKKLLKFIGGNRGYGVEKWKTGTSKLPQKQKKEAKALKLKSC